MPKRVSTHGIKKHRHYTYAQAADKLGVSPQTVRSWRSDGLIVLDGRRPHYILGEALIEFLKDRRERRSVNLGTDQFFCFTCRAPRRPYGMMVDYVPVNATRGCLEALCAVCEGPCQRFTSEASLNALGKIFEIVRRNAKQAVVEHLMPTPNHNFGGCAKAAQNEATTRNMEGVSKCEK